MDLRRMAGWLWQLLIRHRMFLAKVIGFTPFRYQLLNISSSYLLVSKLFSHEGHHLVSYVRCIVSGLKQSSICNRKTVVTFAVACTLSGVSSGRTSLCRGIETDYFFLACCMCYTASMRKVGLDFSTRLILHICNKLPPSMVAGSVVGG